MFDSGWRSKAVLELATLGRMAVALDPEMLTCSFAFEPLSFRTNQPY